MDPAERAEGGRYTTVAEPSRAYNLEDAQAGDNVATVMISGEVADTIVTSVTQFARATNSTSTPAVANACRKLSSEVYNNLPANPERSDVAASLAPAEEMVVTRSPSGEFQQHGHQYV